jgi:hypothetical protein
LTKMAHAGNLQQQSWLGEINSNSINKEKTMDQNHRVLSRVGARELTEEEAGFVTGGLTVHTETLCSVFNGRLDGDPGEC